MHSDRDCIFSIVFTYSVRNKNCRSAPGAVWWHHSRYQHNTTLQSSTRSIYQKTGWVFLSWSSQFHSESTRWVKFVDCELHCRTWQESQREPRVGRDMGRWLSCLTIVAISPQDMTSWPDSHNRHWVGPLWHNLDHVSRLPGQVRGETLVVRLLDCVLLRCSTAFSQLHTKVNFWTTKCEGRKITLSITRCCPGIRPEGFKSLTSYLQWGTTFYRE